MNGYQMTADAYKKLLEKEPAENTETIARMKCTINALEYLAGADDQTIYELFDSSAFNDIVKGYVKLALANTGTDEEQAKAIMQELRFLFDTKGAAEAESYYTNS